MSFDVAVLGDCDVDIFIRVERLAGWGEKVPGDLISVEGGGVAANFACAASRLGLRTALLTTVGNDGFAAAAMASLEHFGVDTTGVVEKPAPTYFSTVCLDERGEKALTIVRTPTFFPAWEDVDLSILKASRHLHIAPFGMEVSARAAHVARTVGATVSVDLEPAMIRGGLEDAGQLLGQTNVLFVNQFTLETIFGEANHRRSAGLLLDWGPDVVVVTLGAAGVHVATAEEQVRLPAYLVEVQDTTGAGDCFNAAFLAARFQGQNLEECASFATAAAALSIGTVGARSSIPTREAVARFLDAHGPPGSQTRTMQREGKLG